VEGKGKREFIDQAEVFRLVFAAQQESEPCVLCRNGDTEDQRLRAEVDRACTSCDGGGLECSMNNCIVVIEIGVARPLGRTVVCPGNLPSRLTIS